jgi:5-methylcytosine-specific restriction endonuclease McrA
VSKKDYNVTILPAFDEQLRRTMRERKQWKRKVLHEKWLAELELERSDQDQQFWRTYSAYLKSDHWQDLRRAVLQRDHSKCQNCFCAVTERSAHVHHTSYVGFQRLGYSFAFECVTLCRTCHDAFHGGLDRAR